MQERVAEDLEALLAAAQEESIEILITHVYRSVEEQRQLFTQRLQRQGFTFSQLADGASDIAIDAVLQQASPPGYSRHHSGYTLDFRDSSAPFFATSPAYAWLSADNFENAKQFGFIPSYPEGVPDQGPNPETWEFVWVGKGLTFERP